MFLFGSICWWFSLSLLAVAVFSGVATLVFLLCNYVNNFFALLFYISFFIKNIYVGNTNWIGYIVCISTAALFLLVFAIKMIFFDKVEFKKSKFLVAIIVSSVAFLLGGVIGRFDFLISLIVFAFCIATMLLYLISRYRTFKLEKYLAKLFIIGGLFLTFNIYIQRIVIAGTIFIGKPEGELFFFSSQPLNPASIFIMLAMVGCYRLGVGKKFDVLYFIYSLFFFLSVVLTSVRTSIAVASILLVVLYVLYVKRSKRKLNFLWVALAVFLLVFAGVLIFKTQVENLIQMLVAKFNSGLNGRDELWPWCIEKFKDYPIFGYGFVADESVPSLSYGTTVVLAHNTILQWVTSLGIIGTILMLCAYFVKYKICFSGCIKMKIFVILAIVSIELTGMLDQAPSMDFFMYMLSIVLVSSCEKNDSDNVEIASKL